MNIKSKKDQVIHEVIIEPLKGWSNPGLREIWEYRDLIWLFAKRNFSSQYRQMGLGPVWSVLKPIIDVVIFTLIFGQVAKLPSDGVEYAVFAYVALVPWAYFSQITTATSSSLVNEMSIITKVYFPRLVIPISSVVSGFIEFCISMTILFIFLLLNGIQITWQVIYLPFYLLIGVIFGLGIGLWIATLAVRFRDFRNVAGYGLQILKFTTPIVYSASLVSPQWLPLYRLNPLYWVVEGFRNVLLQIGESPSLQMLPALGIGLLLLVSGTFIFWRNERTVVDWL